MREEQQLVELMQTVAAAMTGLLVGLLTGIGLALLMLSALGLTTWSRKDK